MTKRALITGITGQDGAYLSDFLLKKGYKVYGAVRRTSSINTARLSYMDVLDNIELVSMDLGEITNIQRAIEKIEPDEIYNLAAQSFVQTSYEQPIYTSDIDGIGVTRLLETIRNLGGKPKFYQASTSEMFGKAKESPQNENTPFYPRSPYGIAKLYSHWMTINYRESWDMHACSGILFNHESPLRPKRFVTQKIISSALRISKGADEILELGRLDISRDWGWAPEYVEAMWLMLQQENPDDYVIATGETNTLESFVTETFNSLGLDWKKHVRQKEIFMRPTDIEISVGDASKAHLKLGWKPKNKMKEVIALMLQAVN